MRTAGVGLWRLSLPYFGVAFLLGLVVLAMNELLVRRRRTGPRKFCIATIPIPPAASGSRVNFHNETDGRTWQIDRYNRATGEMIAPKIIWDRTDGSFGSSSPIAVFTPTANGFFSTWRTG